MADLNAGLSVHRLGAQRGLRAHAVVVPEPEAACTLAGSHLQRHLGIAGEVGVREVLRNILAELDTTLGLSGHPAIGDVGLDALRPA